MTENRTGRPSSSFKKLLSLAGMILVFLTGMILVFTVLLLAAPRNEDGFEAMSQKLLVKEDVSWTVGTLRGNGDLFQTESTFESGVSSILHSINGWERAGVSFAQIAQPYNNPDILLIFLYDARELEQICDEISAGCAWTDGNQCWIFLWHGWKTPIAYQVLNHELGHCFGLPHSDDPTMLMFHKANGTIPYPTDSEITIIKQKKTALQK